MTVIVIPDRFMLKPIGKGYNSCFELHEWREGGKKQRYKSGPNKGQEYTSEAGWKFTGAYPTTLQRGCELILERFALSGEEVVELKEAVSRLQDMTEQIKGAIDA